MGGLACRDHKEPGKEAGLAPFTLLGLASDFRLSNNHHLALFPPAQPASFQFLQTVPLQGLCPHYVVCPSAWLAFLLPPISHKNPGFRGCLPRHR